MVNSRDISLLRDDVEHNVRVFLQLCEAQGLRVLITQTVRDDEYQAYLYEQGRTRPGSIVTNSKRTTFHGAGLAFDICQNIKGQEYSDAAFFVNCAAIAKHLGFSWGGDWKNFPDRPHFQWDEGGKYKFNRSKSPAQMPLHEEVNEVRYHDLEELKSKPTYYQVMKHLYDAGIFRGKAGGDLDINEDMIRIFVVNYRAGVYDAALLSHGIVRDKSI